MKISDRLFNHSLRENINSLIFNKIIELTHKKSCYTITFSTVKGFAALPTIKNKTKIFWNSLKQQHSSIQFQTPLFHSLNEIRKLKKVGAFTCFTNFTILVALVRKQIFPHFVFLKQEAQVAQLMLETIDKQRNRFLLDFENLLSQVDFEKVDCVDIKAIYSFLSIIQELHEIQLYNDLEGVETEFETVDILYKKIFNNQLTLLKKAPDSSSQWGYFLRIILREDTKLQESLIDWMQHLEGSFSLYYSKNLYEKIEALSTVFETLNLIAQKCNAEEAVRIIPLIFLNPSLKAVTVFCKNLDIESIEFSKLFQLPLGLINTIKANHESTKMIFNFILFKSGLTESFTLKKLLHFLLRIKTSDWERLQNSSPEIIKELVQYLSIPSRSTEAIVSFESGLSFNQNKRIFDYFKNALPLPIDYLLHCIHLWTSNKNLLLTLIDMHEELGPSFALPYLSEHFDDIIQIFSTLSKQQKIDLLVDPSLVESLTQASLFHSNEHTGTDSDSIQALSTFYKMEDKDWSSFKNIPGHLHALYLRSLLMLSQADQNKTAALFQKFLLKEFPFIYLHKVVSLIGFGFFEEAHTLCQLLINHHPLNDSPIKRLLNHPACDNPRLLAALVSYYYNSESLSHLQRILNFLDSDSSFVIPLLNFLNDQTAEPLELLFYILEKSKKNSFDRIVIDCLRRNALSSLSLLLKIPFSSPLRRIAKTPQHYILFYNFWTQVNESALNGLTPAQVFYSYLALAEQMRPRDLEEVVGSISIASNGPSIDAWSERAISKKTALRESIESIKNEVQDLFNSLPDTYSKYLTIQQSYIRLLAKAAIGGGCSLNLPLLKRAVEEKILEQFYPGCFSERHLENIVRWMSTNLEFSTLFKQCLLPKPDLKGYHELIAGCCCLPENSSLTSRHAAEVILGAILTPYFQKDYGDCAVICFFIHKQSSEGGNLFLLKLYQKVLFTGKISKRGLPAPINHSLLSQKFRIYHPLHHLAESAIFQASSANLTNGPGIKTLDYLYDQLNYYKNLIERDEKSLQDSSIDPEYIISKIKRTYAKSFFVKMDFSSNPTLTSQGFCQLQHITHGSISNINIYCRSLQDFILKTFKKLILKLPIHKNTLTKIQNKLFSVITPQEYFINSDSSRINAFWISSIGCNTNQILPHFFDQPFTFKNISISNPWQLLNTLVNYCIALPHHIKAFCKINPEYRILIGNESHACTIQPWIILNKLAQADSHTEFYQNLLSRNLKVLLSPSFVRCVTFNNEKNIFPPSSYIQQKLAKADLTLDDLGTIYREGLRQYYGCEGNDSRLRKIEHFLMNLEDAPLTGYKIQPLVDLNYASYEGGREFVGVGFSPFTQKPELYFCTGEGWPLFSNHIPCWDWGTIELQFDFKEI